MGQLGVQSTGGRRVAYEVLLRVLRGGAWSGLALDVALRERGDLERREKALATEIVYGTLRRAPTLDHALSLVSERPLSELEDRVLVLLRMGAYQLFYMRVPDHAAVSETVSTAKQAGATASSGYINGVLRALARHGPPEPAAFAQDPRSHILLAESLPTWLYDEWIKVLTPEEILDLAHSLNIPARLCLRAASHTHRERVLERLGEAGVKALAAKYSSLGILIEDGMHPEQIPGWEQLGLQAQDEGAQLVTQYALLPSNVAGDAGGPATIDTKVLDACAGPGGKTCHLAQALPEATVVAVDLHRRRAERVAAEAHRLGVHDRVETHAADATMPLPFLNEESCDLVLVDAPCTGLGTLRRHPEIKLLRGPDDIARLAVLQRRLLDSVSRYVAPGGLLAYAVCTSTEAEGPKVVESFLSDHPSFEMDRPIVDQGIEACTPNWNELLDVDGSLRLFTHRHGTDAFFSVRLRRTR